jgi:uncharacterized RDD family membrane protein YckC
MSQGPEEENPFAAPSVRPGIAADPKVDLLGRKPTLAPFWRRAIALLIDLGICIGLIWVALIGLLVLVILIEPTGFSSFASKNEPLAVLLLNAFVCSTILTYFTLLEASAWQATLGKRILGIRVADRVSRSIGLGRALGRNLGKLVSILPYGIGVWWMLFNIQRQTLHDRIAGTIVVEVLNTASLAEVDNWEES